MGAKRACIVSSSASLACSHSPMLSVGHGLFGSFSAVFSISSPATLITFPPLKYVAALLLARITPSGLQLNLYISGLFAAAPSEARRIFNEARAKRAS